MIGTSEAAALMAVDIIVQPDDARPPADDPPRAHTQLRQLKKLARYVERVTDIDVVRQHSDRRHRVRLASEAQIAELEIVHNKLLPDDPRPDAAGEYEAFGDDERLAREHVEYFYEEYLEDAGYPQ